LKFRPVQLSSTAALTVCALVLALAFSATAGAKPRPTVKLANTSLGKILVNGSGRTLYAFARDGRNKDRCVAMAGCTTVWPLLTATKKPVAGPGVKGSMLGTIKIPGMKARQVTYAGRPLYTYSADTSPGQTDYVGISQFGGVWSAVSAAGKTIR
jgi:predicted lipoprotein with Yx(FWY)xxD motif